MQGGTGNRVKHNDRNQIQMGGSTDGKGGDRGGGEIKGKRARLLKIYAEEYLLVVFRGGRGSRDVESRPGREAQGNVYMMEF